MSNAGCGDEAMTTFSLVWLVPALPLAVGIVNLLFGKRLGKSAGWIGAIAVAAAFVLSIAVVGPRLGLPAGRRAWSSRHLFDWITVGAFSLDGRRCGSTSSPARCCWSSRASAR